MLERIAGLISGSEQSDRLDVKHGRPVPDHEGMK
jgi:hypothetical protein